MRISDWSSDVCSSDLRQDRIKPDGGRPDRRIIMGALPRQQCKGVNEQYTLSLRPDERLSRLGKHRFGGACIQIACKFAPDACLYELPRSLALFHISLSDGEIGRASGREKLGPNG